MKKIRMCSLLLGLVLMLCTFGVANATLVTFDDLPAPFGELIPNGYAGLDWNNMSALNPVASSYGPGSGYVKGIVSSPKVAYNGSGHPATTSRVGTFDFNGAYFTSAFYDNNVLTLTGKYSGTTLYTLTVNLMTSGPQWVLANFRGIDEVDFSTSNAQFAMDNFTYNAAPVPIPAAVWLLGSGLIGLVGIRRKFLK